MTSEYELPSEYDVIVVGTGLVESIVAASAARVKKSVLHLDSWKYYGGIWATFSLDVVEELINELNNKSDQPPDSVGADLIDKQECNIVPFQNEKRGISNAFFRWYIPNSKEVPEADVQKNRDEPASDSLTKNSEEEQVKKETNEDDSEIKPDVDETKNKTVSQESGDQNIPITFEKKNIILPSDCTKQKVMELSRKFNIDMVPKIIYASGNMVELLIHSSVCRYTEFFSINNVLAYMDSSIKKVPCSRADVFTSKELTVLEKRVLMKALDSCYAMKEDSPEYKEYENKTFLQYLQDHEISPNIIPYILFSIAMGTVSTSFKDAMTTVRKFIRNVGKYGNSPFLWPLFGSGELLQAFCRLCAVYGGIYYLGRGAESLVVNKSSGQCTGIISSKKFLKAQHVVTSVFACPSVYFQSEKLNRKVTRIVLITDRSLYSSSNEKEGVSVLFCPPKGGSLSCANILIELPSITGACPKGAYIVHITGQTASDEEASGMFEIIDELFERDETQADVDLSQLASQLKSISINTWLSKCTVRTEEEVKKRPKILYLFHYNVSDSSGLILRDEKPENLHLCNGPDLEIDYEESIRQAEEIFKKMYPDEVFLEPTPDPSERLIGDIEEESDIFEDSCEVNVGKDETSGNTEQQGSEAEKNISELEEEATQ